MEAAGAFAEHLQPQRDLCLAKPTPTLPSAYGTSLACEPCPSSAFWWLISSWWANDNARLSLQPPWAVSKAPSEGAKANSPKQQVPLPASLPVISLQ